MQTLRKVYIKDLVTLFSLEPEVALKLIPDSFEYEQYFEVGRGSLMTREPLELLLHQLELYSDIAFFNAGDTDGFGVEWTEIDENIFYDVYAYCRLLILLPTNHKNISPLSTFNYSRDSYRTSAYWNILRRLCQLAKASSGWEGSGLATNVFELFSC